MATRKKIIVILGMHRCGTNILSRSMRILGASLGDHLMDHQPCSPKGFFEYLDIYELNEKLLSQIGQQWHSLSPISENNFNVLVYENKNYAIILSRQKLEKENIFSFKFPRKVVLIPFWQSVFRKLRVPVSYVTIIRDPISVVLSLHERDKFNIERGILLWKKYNLSIPMNTKMKNNLFLFFNDLATFPKETIKRISSFFSLSISQKELDSFLNDFLDENLIHQTNENNCIDEYQKIPDKIKDLYQIFLEAQKITEQQDLSIKNQKNLRLVYVNELFSTTFG